MQSDVQSDDDLDPRVQGELETLNLATDDINRWETLISEERAKFKELLNSASQRLSVLGKKLGKSIERARAYYETMKEVKQAQCALERAAQNFQKSNGVHRAAKETISLAEQRLSEFNDPKVDAAWQEVMNLQTIRFMDAERDRSRSEKIHQQATMRYEYLQKKASKLKQKHKTSTSKTRMYYETKEGLEAELQKQQKRVVELHDNIKEAKSRYRCALANLEKISLEIHQQRQLAKLQLEYSERLPGEGCDSPGDDNLAAMAKMAQFDLKENKSYDDLDSLEAELDGFELEDGWSGEDEDSSDEEFSESSESSDRRSVTSPTTPKRILRRNTSKTSQEETLDGAKSLGGSRRSQRKLKLKQQDSLLEENVFSESNVKPSNDVIMNSRRKSASSDVTFDTLHGVSNYEGGDQSDDYDIFEDLC